MLGGVEWSAVPAVAVAFRFGGGAGGGQVDRFRPAVTFGDVEFEYSALAQFVFVQSDVVHVNEYIGTSIFGPDESEPPRTVERHQFPDRHLHLLLIAVSTRSLYRCAGVVVGGNPLFRFFVSVTGVLAVAGAGAVVGCEGFLE